MRTIAEHFPAGRRRAITHHWGGPLGVPRDWCCSVHYDPADRLRLGRRLHRATASSRATCSAARSPIWCCERDSDLVSLPWVGHESRRWEPEPLRFLASRAIVRTLGSADRDEDRRDRPAWRTRLVRPVHAGPLVAPAASH